MQIVGEGYLWADGWHGGWRTWRRGRRRRCTRSSSTRSTRSLPRTRPPPSTRRQNCFGFVHVESICQRILFALNIVILLIKAFVSIWNFGGIKLHKYNIWPTAYKITVSLTELPRQGAPPCSASSNRRRVLKPRLEHPVVHGCLIKWFIIWLRGAMEGGGQIFFQVCSIYSK